MDRLKSRKLWIAIGAVLLVIGASLHGDISVADAVNKLVVLVIGYLSAQGAVDVVTAAKK